MDLIKDPISLRGHHLRTLIQFFREMELFLGKVFDLENCKKTHEISFISMGYSPQFIKRDFNLKYFLFTHPEITFVPTKNKDILCKGCNLEGKECLDNVLDKEIANYLGYRLREEYKIKELMTPRILERHYSAMELFGY